MVTKVKDSATFGPVEHALAAADPQLGQVIRSVIPKIGRLKVKVSKTPHFEALVRAILYQRMTANGAEAVFKRLKQSMNGAMNPGKVIKLGGQGLKNLGFSDAKAHYTLNLANWFLTNRQTANQLANMSNDEISDALTRIPGIGKWTVNVFLIFNLGRSDVIPASDFGIQRAVQAAYGLKKLPAPAEILRRALLWKPYRSLASMYLWQSVKLKSSRELRNSKT
ncbi:MAG: DNA-3-methyladenine glycosylase [Verrucomicrobiota bacterium]|jgi:DNA-3-methyladenine glycosylase II